MYLSIADCYNKIEAKELRSSSELSKQNKQDCAQRVVRLAGWESKVGIRREVQVGQGQELVQPISKDAMRLYLVFDFTVLHLFKSFNDIIAEMNFRGLGVS